MHEKSSASLASKCSKLGMDRLHAEFTFFFIHYSMVRPSHWPVRNTRRISPARSSSPQSNEYVSIVRFATLTAHSVPPATRGSAPARTPSRRRSTSSGSRRRRRAIQTRRLNREHATPRREHLKSFALEETIATHHDYPICLHGRCGQLIDKREAHAPLLFRIGVRRDCLATRSDSRLRPRLNLGSVAIGRIRLVGNNGLRERARDIARGLARRWRWRIHLPTRRQRGRVLPARNYASDHLVIARIFLHALVLTRGAQSKSPSNTDGGS